MRTDSDLRRDVLLSAQRALLGEISPAMRAIALELTPGLVHVYVYHDGAADPEEADDFDAVVMTQLVADFPWIERGDPRMEFSFVRVDEPEPVPVRGSLVYARKGTTTRAV